MTKRQEILNLIKKVLSLSLVALIAVLSMTSCNFFSESTNNPGYDGEEFGNLVDPTAPLTEEQIEKAKKVEEYLSSFEYNFKEKGIRSIQLRKPRQESSETIYIAEISYEDGFLHGINIRIDRETYYKLLELTNNCNSDKISGIEKITFEEVEKGDAKYQYNTIFFNEEGNVVLQKYLSMLQPFFPDSKDPYIEGSEMITEVQKNTLLDFLCQRDTSFKHGIAFIELTHNTSTENYNEKFFIKIKNMADFKPYTLFVTEEQYNRFNKYLEFKNLCTEKTDKNIEGDSLQIKSFYLLRNDSISDTLKDQICYDIYKICEENNLLKADRNGTVQTE